MSVNTDVGGDIASAVVGALSELSEIVADETADAGQYKYRYATLAVIMRTVRPVLAAHGLVVSQQLAGDEGTIAVQTVLEHRSGVQHASGWLTVKAPPSAQQVGSWVSYLRRYQLVALLGLAIEDDDGRSAGAPGAAQPPPTRVRPLSESQASLIAGLFQRLGLGDPDLREARLALITEALGRQITTTNEVTGVEAGRLIDWLRERVADEEGAGSYGG